jgi:hypothetical protein
VRPNGVGACHTRDFTEDQTGTARMSCYYRTVTDTGALRFS